MLLKERLQAALMRLNQWMTEEQAERVIFELEHVNATGMARNQILHEYLTYGMLLRVVGASRSALTQRSLLRLQTPGEWSQ